MAETKIRYYLNSSAIGSYFGVGFNEPEDQLQIDLGLAEDSFDDAAQARMDLGNTLEDPVLDYFENLLNIIIDERNEELLVFYDEKCRGKLDGMTTWNGIRTVVECKISNAQSYKFTENMGYLFQVQAYMLATGAEQAILLGLYQGKPVYKVIPRDEEMIADIKEMADFIYEMLIGLGDWEDYPTHLYEKYSNKQMLQSFEEVTELDEAVFTDLAKLKKEYGDMKKQIDAMEGLIKDKYKTGKFENDDFKLTLSEGRRKGGYDVDRISIEHPEIDFEKYRKEDSVYRSIRVTKKKAK